MHSFDFYLEDFFKTFFPNENINALKLKVDEEIKKENEKIYQYNLKLIDDYGEKIKNKITERTYENIYGEMKAKLEKLFKNI